MKNAFESILKKLKQKEVFIEYSKEVFCLKNGYKITYYYCKRGTKTSDRTETAEKMYASYYIIDLTEPQTYELCISTILRSFDDFSEFQNEHLSKDFFFENGSLRYNLYLVFICDDNTKDQIRNKTEDFNYARKLVLSLEDFEEYFDFFSKKNNLTTKALKTEMEMPDLIRRIVSKLEENQCKSLLVPSDENQELVEYCLSNSNRKLDSSKKNKQTANKFIEKNFYQQSHGAVPQRYQVKNITRIVLNSFRTNCFSENEEIQAGIVNVFYGDNTVGKSSILDAIEFGFTGKTHKNKEDYSKSDTFVKIVGNNTFIESHKAAAMENQLKYYWYKNKIGELNELFCRINYFNTDATYRFALEDGNLSDAINHIRNLLCNSKLIEIENTLLEKELELSRILDFLNYASKGRKDRQEKKKKSVFKKNHMEDSVVLDNYKKRIEKTKQLLSICTETQNEIKNYIDKQLKSNLELINIIFHRIYSFESNIFWKENTIIEQKKNFDKYNTIQTMSTAQKICLALSVIFCQFFISETAPRIILLDESVANFDNEHLLNLLDFLRDIALNKIQVFFTTANPGIAKNCNKKFSFFEDYCLYNVTKDEYGKTKVNRKDPS